MREWLIRLTLIAFGSIIGMIALEFGLSKFAPHPKTWPIGFHVRNKYIGWKGIPGKEGRWVKGRIVSYVKMNSHGFRDGERKYEKEQDVFRIVVLGDSYTEGLQVPFEQTFPYILEKRLNSESPKRVEVITLGVSGFGTAQEYLTLKLYGLKYNPDLVIQAFYTNNDVRDNSLILDSLFPDTNTNKPYFVLENGKLKEIPFKIKVTNPGKDEGQTKIGVTGQLQTSKGLLTKLFPNIWYSLSDRINETPRLANSFWEIGIKKPKPNPVLSDESKEKGFNNVYAEECPPEWRNAWEVTKALILELSKELEMNRIGFLVVIIPGQRELQTDGFELPRNLNKYPQRRTVKLDLRKPERILSNFLEVNKIDYLLLRPGLEKYIRETGKDLNFRYSYENHWNANGHEIAAQLIYRKLKDDKLVPAAEEND